jgi:biotin transporter BioY
VIVSLWESSASTLPANDQPRQGVNTLAGCLAGWLAGWLATAAAAAAAAAAGKKLITECFLASQL